MNIVSAIGVTDIGDISGKAILDTAYKMGKEV